MPINSKRDITSINQVDFGHNKLLWSCHRTVTIFTWRWERVKGLAKSQVVLENALNNLELRLDRDILPRPQIKLLMENFSF